MRPEISEKTEDKIRDWMDEHPEKGITNVGAAIDFLIPKGIEKDSEKLDYNMDEEAVREIVKEELDKEI